METPVYEEKQVHWVRYLLVIIPPAAIIISYFADPGNMMNAVFSFVVAIAVGVTIFGFTTLTIVVTPTELLFGFPLWKKRVALSTVKVGQIKTISLLAGTGIHYWKGKWVYNIRHGNGLSLVINNSKYLLGSGQPKKLQSILWQVARRMEA